MEDNQKLYELRENEILEQLGKMEETDPNRKPLVNELESYARIRTSYEANELNRLSKNAENDINEARLVLESEKLKNEKLRNKIITIQSLLSMGLGGFLYYKSYHMDEKGLPYKDLKRQGLTFIDEVRTKFRR